MSGVDVPLLTITEDVNNEEENSKKRVLIATGRIHPGESNGSWVTQGFLEWICGMSEEAVFLRRHVVIKVIPMLNPDGVIAGNFRTGLAGNDLNRKFAEPNEKLHPTVFAMKKMVEELRAKKIKVWAYLDFHGHSTKKNVFIYAPEFPVHSPYYYKNKILPKLISLRTDMFRFHSCIFRVAKGKLTTARAVFSMDYGVQNCFTVEASFSSYVNSAKETKPFVSELFVEMGGHIAFGVFEYLKLLEEEEALREKRRLERLKKKKLRQKKKLWDPLTRAEPKPEDLATASPLKNQGGREILDSRSSTSFGQAVQAEVKMKGQYAQLENADYKLNKFPFDNSTPVGGEKETFGATVTKKLSKSKNPSGYLEPYNKKSKSGAATKKKKMTSKKSFDLDDAELGINRLRDVKRKIVMIIFDAFYVGNKSRFEQKERVRRPRRTRGRRIR